MTKTVTYEEWLSMPEVEDAVEEVVNGEIRIMQPAKLAHGVIVQNIHSALRAQLDRTRFLALCSNFGLIIRKRPLTSRVPDLAVFERTSVAVQDGTLTLPRNSQSRFCLLRTPAGK